MEEAVQPVQPVQPGVGDILAGVERSPRERCLELGRTLKSWPEVAEGTYHHAGEWSPVYLVHGRQLLHVHFHKPHLISVSLAVSGRPGEAALAEPGVAPAMRQRIEREWGAGEAYVEFRINSDEDLRSIEAAARAIYRQLAGERPG